MYNVRLSYRTLSGYNQVLWFRTYNTAYKFGCSLEHDMLTLDWDVVEFDLYRNVKRKYNNHSN